MAKKIGIAKKEQQSVSRPKTAVSKKSAGVAKQKHKRRVKGTSELDNPKYASMDFMLAMIDKTTEKVEEKEAQRLARRTEIEKKIEEKQGKRDKKKEERQEKLEKAKQQLLKKNKNKKPSDKMKKGANKNKEEEEKPVKKRVRFA